MLGTVTIVILLLAINIQLLRVVKLLRERERVVVRASKEEINTYQAGRVAVNTEDNVRLYEIDRNNKRKEKVIP